MFQNCSAKYLYGLLCNDGRAWCWKGCDDPYFLLNSAKAFIKLKKDTIADLGDTADFAMPFLAWGNSLAPILQWQPNKATILAANRPQSLANSGAHDKVFAGYPKPMILFSPSDSPLCEVKLQAIAWHN